MGKFREMGKGAYEMREVIGSSNDDGFRIGYLIIG